MMPHIVIIAGGQGSRFWPASRKSKPKQFLSIKESGESLIRVTAQRMAPLSDEGALWVITNHLHESLVKEHVPSAKIVAEPMARNTAAAIGLGAIKIQKEHDDGVMVVLPADHAVRDETKLLSTLREGISLATSGDHLVTVGVQPTSPNTAYGYIRKGDFLKGNGYQVQRFYEKPSLSRAVEYCESGEYFWNSGMFIWKASTILAAIEEFMPSLSAGLKTISDALGTPKEGDVIKEVFEGLESTSIDFGVLEHARNCAVIVAEPFGWNDVGSWDAWSEHFDKDSNGNMANGDVILLDSSNNVVHCEDKFAALLGVNDLVLIQSGNAILLCHRERVQDVKKIVSRLEEEGKESLV